MKRIVRYSIVTAVLYGLYVVGIWAAIRAVSRPRAFLSVPFWALVVLGAIVAGVIVWYLWRRAPAAAPQDDDIMNLFAAANSYLANGAATKGKSLRNTDVVVVLGTRASAKTTVVSRSPIEATLLAGQTRQEGTVAPPETPVGNVWYTARALVVEAGHTVIGNAQRWPLFVRQLLPSRGFSALFRGTQASRVAVVCVSCDDLASKNAPDKLASISKSLNAALSDLAVSLGVRLPTYVVFTQADLIPGFTEVAITMTRDETRQVIGATLPIVANEAAGLYGEQQTARLTKPFTDLYHAFALDRHQTLSRGADIKERASAYEFAREFRKIIPGAVQFLVDLCRPNPLRPSPFLRGFYFVGLRPIVAERASEAVLDAGPRLPVEASATVVLSAPKLAEARQQRAGAVPNSGRRPQWVFLDRLFSEVVLADEGALGVTTQGKRVDATRRGAAIIGAAVAALAILAFMISFAANSNLIDRAGGAIRASSAASAGTGQSVAALAAVDSVRTVLLTLDLDQSGRADPPFTQRFGLYQGQTLLPSVRKSYFAAFNKLLMTPTRKALETSLLGRAGVQPQPTAFDSAYTALKAYLITTDFPDSVTPALTPALATAWPGRVGASHDALELAERQFDFYRTYLPRNKDLGTTKSNPQALSSAREFLAQYHGAERVYKLMLDDAARHTTDFVFSQRYPESKGIVTTRFAVRGPFTREGWAVMQREMNQIGVYAVGERWVTGDAQQSTIRQDDLKKQVQQQYVSDYVGQWREYLKSAQVPDLGSGWQEVGRNIQRIGSRDSPLLRFLAAAARNTGVDSSVKTHFQAIHHIEPKADTDVVVNEANQPYIEAVTALGRAADGASAAQSNSDPSIAEVQKAVNQVNDKVAQLSDGFVTDPDAHLEKTVIALLNRPAEEARALVSRSGKSAADAENFCADFAKIAAKYPFDTTGDPVSIKEFSDMFAPVSGKLAKMVARSGLQRRAGRYAKGNASQISDSFLNFINKAAQITDSLFVAGGIEPRFSLGIRPEMDIRGSLAADQDSLTFAPHVGNAQTLHWRGFAATHATIQLHYESDFKDTRPTNWPNVPGNPWALLRLFEQASRTRQAPFDVYSFGVRAPHKAELRIEAGVGQDVLNKKLFQMPECKP